jgi:hypothetical protein
MIDLDLDAVGRGEAGAERAEPLGRHFRDGIVEIADRAGDGRAGRDDVVGAAGSILVTETTTP